MGGDAVNIILPFVVSDGCKFESLTSASSWVARLDKQLQPRVNSWRCCIPKPRYNASASTSPRVYDYVATIGTYTYSKFYEMICKMNRKLESDETTWVVYVCENPVSTYNAMFLGQWRVQSFCKDDTSR